MEKIKLPVDVLNKLRCQLCTEYLSYEPIILHAESGSVCGRCPTLEKELNTIPLREKNYETLAKHLLLFPCRYLVYGCSHVLPMDDIPLHEACCPLKPYFCPILPLGACPWQGATLELNLHFATDHMDFLLNTNTFEVDLVHNYKTTNLMAYFDNIFLVYTQYDLEEATFYCSVHQVMTTLTKYFYSIEFYSRNGQYPMTLDQRELPQSQQGNISKKDGYSIKLEEMRSKLGEPSMVMCKIDITEIVNEKPLIEVDITEEDEETEEFPNVIEDTMMLDIECPVCQEFMMPPIYQCYTGHSICGRCKSKLRDCPSCRGKYGETRNFTLEKLTERMLYACKNRLSGCTYKANPTEIQAHEKTCTYAPIHCPFHRKFSCEWTGMPKNIIDHAKTVHSNDLLLGNLFINDVNVHMTEGHEVQKLTQIHGEMFMIKYGYSTNRSLYATVELVGTPEDAEKFMYEVNVVDLNKKCLQLMSKKFCGSMNSENVDACRTLWHLDMILPLMSQDKQILLQYKIINA